MILPRQHTRKQARALDYIGQRLHNDQITWDDALELRRVVLQAPPHTWPDDLRCYANKPPDKNAKIVRRRDGYAKRLFDHDDALKIRAAYRANPRVKLADLGKAFNAHEKTIYKVIRGKRPYSELPDLVPDRKPRAHMGQKSLAPRTPDNKAHQGGDPQHE